jgi:hypothetical protein
MKRPECETAQFRVAPLLKIRGNIPASRRYNIVTWFLINNWDKFMWEQGAEEDIWTEEGWGDGRMEKIA